MLSPSESNEPPIPGVTPEDVATYSGLIDAFRGLIVCYGSPSCQIVDDFGTPRCCDGVTLSFTSKEIAVLLALFPGTVSMQDFKWTGSDWTLRNNDPEVTRPLFREGWVCGALESVSHPTRPVLEDERVVGVATLTGCCNIVEDLRRNKAEFLRLWQIAATTFGVKPYYRRHKARWPVL